MNRDFLVTPSSFNAQRQEHVPSDFAGTFGPYRPARRFPFWLPVAILIAVAFGGLLAYWRAA